MAVLGRLGVVTFGAFGVAALTAAVALGLRVLVLRALGAAADAVIKRLNLFDSYTIHKKIPLWGFGGHFVNWFTCR